MTALIGKSVDRTGQVLFKPFSVRKWLTLLFIAFMAGALSTGSGGGGGSGGDSEKEASAQTVDISSMNQIAPVYDQGQDLNEGDGEPKRSRPWFKRLGFGGALIIGIVLVLLFFLWWLFMTWLGARFHFVWFHAMVNNVSEIVNPFKKYHMEGNSLFKFYIVLTVIVLTYVLVILSWVIAVGLTSGVFQKGFVWSFPVAMGLFGPPLGFFLISFLCFIIFSVVIDDFVVTIMALDSSTFRPAWGKFTDVYKKNRKDLWIYLLVKFGLGLLTGIAQFILVFFGLIFLLLIGGLLFGLSYLLIVSVMKAKLIYIVLAVLFGVPFVLAALLTLMCIVLPFAVFFRSLSLYFLSSLKQGYEPLPL